MIHQKIIIVLIKMGYQNAEIKSFYICSSCKISPSAQQGHDLSKIFLEIHGSQPYQAFNNFF